MFFRRGRRRQIVVDKKFQARYVFIGAFYVCLASICLALPFAPLFNTMNTLVVGQTSHVAELVQRQQRLSVLTFVLSSLWVVAAWVYFSLRRSHKIAGPSYKLTQFMRGIDGNNLGERVTLRAGDELWPIANELNCLLGRLEAGTERPRPSSQDASPDKTVEADRVEADILPT